MKIVEVTMKYKNRLIVPTLITTSLLTSGLVASADEKTEENTYIETNSTASEETDTIINPENEDYINKASDSEHDVSAPQNNEPSTEEEPSLHNESATEETAEISSEKEQHEVHDNDVVENTASEEETLEIVPEETNQPSDEFIEDTDTLNQDEELVIEEKDNTAPDEKAVIEKEATQNQDENNDKEVNNQSLSTENESINEDEKVLNPEEDTEEHVSDENVSTETEDEKVPDQGVTTTDEVTSDKDENSPTQDKDMKDDRNNSLAKDKEVQAEEKDASIDKNDITEATPFLASTFSIASLDKADTNIVTNVDYATRLNNKNSGLYSPVTSDKGVSADKFLNHTMFISQKRQVGGTNFYKIHNGLDGAMQGWMKESDLRLFSIYNREKYNKSFSVNSNYQNDYLLSEPWGTSKQRIKKIKDTGSSIFKAEETISIGATVYHYGTVGDAKGWISDSRLSTDLSPQYSNANYAARINNKRNSGIYSPVTSNNSVSAKRFNNSTLFVSEKAEYNDTTFYKIHNRLDGSMQGWMKASDLGLYNIYNHKKSNKTFSVKSNNQSDYLLSEPLGTSNQRVKRIKDTGSTIFNTQETIKIGAVTFYYGTIGDSKGWISDSRLSTNFSPQYSTASLAARIKNKRNNSGIYSPVTSSNSVSAKGFNNTTLFISEQAEYGGTTYYKIHNSLNGAMQGWMKKQDLQTYGLGKVINHSGTYSVKHDNFSLFSDPYGNSAQRIGSLKSYKNSTFKVEKSVKIGATTHYYGSFGSQKGWISNAALTEYVAPKPPVSSPKVQTVKYGRSLNSVLNTQMSLSTKPQAWVSGGGWRNATRSEVRNFLDTSHQKGGAWDYTFLNLNQRQGISSSVLNRNILNNKGILTNRGNAFSQAARQHGVNEVYLISHAILETGHGSSQLAQGIKLDRNGNRSSNGTTYYNMYGIGAVDHNALLGGARYAQSMGWDTPEKAIIGGAGFVSSNYFARGQNTLYSMRWNPRNPGTYQYATDVNWAYATGRNLQNYYNQLGIRGKYFTRHTF